MDGSLDGSADGYAGRIEIYEGRSGRRMRSEAERARIAAESMVPGAKVSDVARRHAVTRWQVYDWRKKLMAGALALPAETADEPMFAALVLEPERGGPGSSPKGCGSAIKPGRIEMVVDGVTLQPPHFDEEGLSLKRTRWRGFSPFRKKAPKHNPDICLGASVRLAGLQTVCRGFAYRTVRLKDLSVTSTKFRYTQQVMDIHFRPLLTAQIRDALPPRKTPSCRAERCSFIHS